MTKKAKPTGIDVSKLPVETWATEKLIPHPKNAKKHSKEQIVKLAASIKRLGMANPIQVEPDGTIILGHGRRLASIELLWSKVPVIVRSDLTKAEADALRISENLVASTDYDQTLLFEVGAELAITFDDKFALGFTDKELEKLSVDPVEFDENAFTTDVLGAVEDQKRENAEKEKKIDASDAPLATAFGFRRLTIEQSRQVRIFMSKIEVKTGKKGADALIEHIATASSA